MATIPTDVQDSVRGPLRDTSEVILASAGTGKTQKLSARYLQLLHADQPPERILATTFTRKAAGEIFERILKRLADSVDDDVERERLSEQVGATLSRDRCRELLLRLTRSLHQIRVSTLDSFFGQIAKSFGPELGLPPAWEIADELDDQRLRGEALQRMLDKHSMRQVTELVHMLAKGDAERKTNDFLMKTVNELYAFYRDSSGSGIDDRRWKTEGIPPALDENAVTDALEVFQHVSIPDVNAWQQAHSKSFVAISSQNWLDFLSAGIAKNILAENLKFSRRIIPDDVVAAYQPLLRHAVAMLLQQEAMKVRGACDLIQKFAAEYEQLKVDREAIRFDDIPERLSRMGKLQKQLVYRMDSQIDHLLLDEFQDTSGAQWRAIRPFATRVLNREDGSGSLFCVGDVKQAIYGWRGGQAEILESLPQQFEHVGLSHLTKTWRCSRPVVDMVNEVFRGIPRYPDLGNLDDGIRNWCEAFVAHDAARNHPGYAALVTGDFDEDDQDSATLRSAAILVSQLTQSLRPDQTIAVLARRNDKVGKIIDHLRDFDIWASEEGRSPLTDSAAVQQILSACRLADMPGDRVAQFHLQQGLLRDLPAPVSESAFRKIATEFRRRLVEEGYGNVVQSWAECLQPLCSERESRRLRQLGELAFVYQSRLSDSRSGLRAEEFVTFVERNAATDSNSANVRVMVTHQAKGLEFDAVVVVELDRDIIGQSPSFVVRRSNEDFWPEHIFTYTKKDLRPLLPKQARRTQQYDTDARCRDMLCGLYVAMTRAKHGLYMVIAPDDPEKDFKKVPKKIAGLLRTALTTGEAVAPNTTLFETGDAGWYRAPSDNTSEPVEKQMASTAAGELSTRMKEANSPTIRLRRNNKSAGRGQEVLSPSQRSAGALFKGNDWYSRERSSALEYGTLIHAWFERIEWLGERDLFSNGEPDEGDLRGIAIRVPARFVNVDSALADYRKMLTQPEICNLLHQRAYEPEFRRWYQTRTGKQLSSGAVFEVRNEQPIVFAEEGQCGTGTIDRLILVYDGKDVVAADVIDHKTDAAKTESQARDKASFYGPQLRKYRDAVAEMFHLDSQHVRMRLALLNGGRVTDVT